MPFSTNLTRNIIVVTFYINALIANASLIVMPWLVREILRR